MSQDNSLPLLSSASYQALVKASKNRVTKTPTPQASIESLKRGAIINATQDCQTSVKCGSITRSPSMASIPCPSRVSTPPSLSSSGSDISFTPRDIQSMNEMLAQARRDGEMPTTTRSPMDVDAVVEDYGYFTRLRETRGDESDTASQDYNTLRVEIARKIKDRDTRLDEEETKREVSRRVDDFLRSVEKEKVYFTDANAPKTPKTPSGYSSVVNVEELSEELLTIVEQAADQTLVDAAEPLLKSLGLHLEAQKGHQANQEYLQAHLHQSVETQQHLQAHLHYSTTSQQHLQQHLQQHFCQSALTMEGHLNSMQSLASTLDSLMEPQARAVDATTDNLTLLTAIVTHLSQQARTLPPLIHQTVHNVVQQEVQAAIQQVMEAQQVAMLSLLEDGRTRSGSMDSTSSSEDSSRTKRVSYRSRMKGFLKNMQW